MLVKLCSVWIAGVHFALQKFVAEILMYLYQRSMNENTGTLEGRVEQRAKRMEMDGLDSRAHSFQ